MVSESNFILGIKQTSLVSKEDSHVHITDRSHTCLSTRSRLHSISQPPWLTIVSRSSNQASRDLTYQICANPSFAWWNQNHRHAPPPLATKTQKFGHLKPFHAPPRATWVSDFSSARWWTHTLLPRAEICCWCHLTSSFHVNSHASTSTSALVHVSDTS